MKKISSTIIFVILISVFSVFVFIPSHVQAFVSADPTDSAVVAATAGDQTSQQAVNERASDSNGGFDWATLFKIVLPSLNLTGGVLNGPLFLAWSGFLYLVSLILSLAVFLSAGLFDGMMILSISKFSSVVNSSGVEDGWGIIRNFINISFIFILLYISISIILGTFGPKKKSTVASVIVAALLINFSLFFTRIIVDAGNYVAVAFSNQVDGGIGSVSSLIMSGIQAPGIFKWENLTITGQAGTILLLVFQITLLVTITWAFLTAAFLFLGRMIVLIVLMTLSPVGFLGDAIPWISEKSAEWKKTLIDQVAVAPVFCFFLILLNKMVQAGPALKELTGASLNEVSKAWGGSFPLGQLIYSAIVIAMLIGGVKMTKELSGKVGGFAEKIVQALVGATLAIVTGGAAAMAGAGVRIAASGAARAASGRAIAANGLANSRLSRVALGTRAIVSGNVSRALGAGLRTAGNVASGQAFRDAAGNPNLLGTVLTDTMKSFYKTAKKETGLDISEALKYKETYDKDMEKRYGDVANKKGGKKEREELDILNKISKNIAEQTESRHKRDNKAAWDNMERLRGRAKDTEKARLLQDAKTRYESVVAREMGVDLAQHNARKDELTVTIINKTAEKNKYADEVGKGIFGNKKIAQKLRSEATYEAKDKVEDELAKLIKRISPPATPPAGGTPTP